MKCKCENISELWNEEAKLYADSHLNELEIRQDGWEVLYMCPLTKIKWIEEYPRSEEHGGGPLRLYKVKNR